MEGIKANHIKLLNTFVVFFHTNLFILTHCKCHHIHTPGPCHTRGITTGGSSHARTLQEGVNKNECTQPQVRVENVSYVVFLPSLAHQPQRSSDNLAENKRGPLKAMTDAKCQMLGTKSTSSALRRGPGCKQASEHMQKSCL